VRGELDKDGSFTRTKESSIANMLLGLYLLSHREHFPQHALGINRSYTFVTREMAKLSKLELVDTETANTLQGPVVVYSASEDMEPEEIWKPFSDKREKYPVRSMCTGSSPQTS
jgi:hypothetical protein